GRPLNILPLLARPPFPCYVCFMTRSTTAAIWLGVLLIGLLRAGTQVNAQHPRKTPIVEAVQKTRHGIVTLKVRRPAGRKDVVGTGVIVDERGYIVTNGHVIVGAESIAVRLADETELTAKLVTKIESHDLAVIRVQAGKALQALRLGPADDLMV